MNGRKITGACVWFHCVLWGVLLSLISSGQAQDIQQEWRHPAQIAWDGKPLAAAETAARSGEATAQYYLAWINWFGERGQTDRLLARHWFQAAATNSVAEAQFQLGAWAEQGIGEKRNKAKADQWYVLAAQQGNTVAQFRLGLNAPDAVAGGKSGQEWLNMAAAAKYGPALYTKAKRDKRMYFGHDPHRGDYLEAAEQGVTASQYKLVTLLTERSPGKEELTETYKWLLLAKAHGEVEAERYLANAPGRFSTEEQAEGTRRAKEFRVRHASPQMPHWERLYYYSAPQAPYGVTNKVDGSASGDAQSQFERGLALSYESRIPAENLKPIGGDGRPAELVPREAVAVRELRAAAEKGYPVAALLLANHLQNGRGAAVDLDQSRYWLRQIAKAGAVEAQYQLGALTSQSEAYHWHRLAANQGHPEAQAWVKDFTGKYFSKEALVSSHQEDQMKKASAASAARPLRLAIINTDQELDLMADLLMVEISSRSQVDLLERKEIKRIMAEQTLSASGANRLQLGELLGADGMLYMQRQRKDQREFLSLQLVATRPGVVLAESEVPWPVKELAEWAGFAAAKQVMLVPKLAVRREAALPVSLLNFRSALVTGESQALDRQLTELLSRRLIAQPEIFVLDRWRMEQLTAEKNLHRTNESFWNGSVVVDGTVNRDGVTEGRVKVHLRLASPDGRSHEKEVEGGLDELSLVVEKLAAEVVKSTGVKSANHAWEPVAEALQYFEEAQWQLKWQQAREAQQAVESALALGLRTPELSTLLVQCYANFLRKDFHLVSAGRLPATLPAEGLQFCERGLEHYIMESRRYDSASLPSGWAKTGESLLWGVTFLLEHAAYISKRGQLPLDRLQDIRKNARLTAQIIEQQEPPFLQSVVKGHELFRPTEYAKLLMNYSGYWEETFTAGLQRYERAIRAGYYLSLLQRNYGGTHSAMKCFPWDGEDRQVVIRQWPEFIMRLRSDKDPLVALSGHLILLHAIQDSENLRDSFTEAWEFLRANQELFNTGGFPNETVNWVYLYIKPSRGQNSFRAMFQPETIAMMDKESESWAQTILDAAARRVQEEKQKIEDEKFKMVLNALRAATAGQRKVSPDDLNVRGFNLDAVRAEALLPALIQYEASVKPMDSQAHSMRVYLGMALQKAGKPMPPPVFLADPKYPMMTNSLKLTTGPIPGLPPRPVPDPKLLTNGLSVATMVNGLAEVELPPSVHLTMPLATNLAAGESRWRSWKLDGNSLRAEVLTVFHPPARYNGEHNPWVSIGIMEVKLDQTNDIAIRPVATQAFSFGWYNYLEKQAGPSPVSFGGVLYRVSEGRIWTEDGKGSWREMAWDLSGVTQIERVHGRLFAATAESIVELFPASGAVKVLASTRRRPAVTSLDELPSLGKVLLFAGPSGALRLAVSEHVFQMEGNGNDWRKIALLPGTGFGSATMATYGGLVHFRSPHSGIKSANVSTLAKEEVEVKDLLPLFGYSGGGRLPSDVRTDTYWKVPRVLDSTPRFWGSPAKVQMDDDGSLWMFLGPYWTDGKATRPLNDCFRLIWFHPKSFLPLVFKLNFQRVDADLAPQSPMVTSANTELLVNERHIVMVMPDKTRAFIIRKDMLNPKMDRHLSEVAQAIKVRQAFLEERKALWLKFFDRDMNGKLDPAEESIVKVNSVYQDDIRELKELGEVLSRQSTK